MIRVFIAALAAVLLSACGGGGSSAITPATPGATPSPLVQNTAVPVTQGNHVAAAPAQVFTSSGLRKPQSVNLGSGGVPTVVIGYNATMGSAFSNLYTWVVSGSSVPVKETSATASTTNLLGISSVIADNSNLFAATYYDWEVLTNGPYGTGKIPVTVAFGDGTTGIVNYYSYDRAVLICNGVSTPGAPTQWGYSGGVPVGQTQNDVSINCSTNAVTFANGAMLYSSPTADAYGNLAPQMTSVTTVASIPSFSLTTISAPTVGAIYLVKLSDGGCAKVMWVEADTAPTEFISLSLHGSGSACNFSF